ncbi:MAG: C40 family peptidase [Paludibacteraceae bacterium]|nr:C40 family peptidase [Paludibacteraceae bacterium]
MKAITLHSILPVREEPRESAEMGTQLLFGEMVEVLDEKPRWALVKADADSYEGWVDSKMIIKLSTEEAQQVEAAYSGVPKMIKLPVAFALSLGDMKTIPLAAGTRLPNYKSGQFELLGAHFQIDENAVSEPIVFNEQNFLDTSRFFLNCPYLWGGKNMFGYDCSGFTQVLFSLFGKQLPRQASQQAQVGEAVDFLVEAKIGDLAFFDHGDGGNIIHVGILLDDKRILHCSGRVKIEQIDPNGIISTETKQYTHNLRTIRRVF